MFMASKKHFKIYVPQLSTFVLKPDMNKRHDSNLISKRLETILQNATNVKTKTT